MLSKFLKTKLTNLTNDNVFFILVKIVSILLSFDVELLLRIQHLYMVQSPNIIFALRASGRLVCLYFNIFYNHMCILLFFFRDAFSR